MRSMPSACLMRLIVSMLSSLAVAASCGPGLGHLALVQHSAKLRHSLEQRVAVASGSKEQGIWDVMNTITKLGRRFTGAAPELGVQAETAHAQTNEHNTANRDAMHRERSAMRQRQEAKALARNASRKDMMVPENKSETAPAHRRKTEAAPALTANMQPALAAARGNQTQGRHAWKQRQKAKALARNASRQDMMVTDNSPETAPAHGGKTEAAPALTANLQPGVNSSSDRQGQQRNASGRKASEQAAAASANKMAVAAAKGNQNQEHRGWRQRQEAKVRARNASRQDMMSPENVSDTASAHSGKTEAAPALTANVQPGVNSSSDRQGQEANATGRNVSDHGAARSGNNTAVAAAKGNHTEKAHASSTDLQNVHAWSERERLRQQRRVWRRRQEARTLARNASRRDMMAPENKSETPPAHGGKTEAAPAVTAYMQPGVNISSDRQGQQRNASGRNASEQAAAASANKTAVAAARGNQTQERYAWRQRQDANVPGRNASQQDMMVTENTSETPPAHGGKTEAAPAVTAYMQPGVNSSSDRQGQQGTASGRKASEQAGAASANKMAVGATKGNQSQEHRGWRQPQEAKVLARNASRRDMMAPENMSDTASAHSGKTEAAPALTANVQPGVNSSSDRQGQERNASGRNASEHSAAASGNNTAVAAAEGKQSQERLAWEQRHEDKASSRNVSRQDMMAPENMSETTPAHSRKTDAARELPAHSSSDHQGHERNAMGRNAPFAANVKPGMNSSSDRQGQETHASRRNAFEHSAAPSGNSTAVAAANGNQSEMAHASTADLQSVNTSSEREKLRQQRRLWRRRQEAKVLARNASAQESLAA